MESFNNPTLLAFCCLILVSLLAAYVSWKFKFRVVKAKYILTLTGLIVVCAGLTLFRRCDMPNKFDTKAGQFEYMCATHEWDGSYAWHWRWPSEYSSEVRAWCEKNNPDSPPSCFFR